MAMAIPARLKMRMTSKFSCWMIGPESGLLNKKLPVKTKL